MSELGPHEPGVGGTPAKVRLPVIKLPLQPPKIAKLHPLPFSNPAPRIMPTSDPTFFQFEADFVDSLRCIPMQVRYKLDTCGVKLKLEHWHKFPTAARENLVALPCQTPAEVDAYRATLQTLVAQYTQTPAKDLPIDPHPPWEQTATVPTEVVAQAQQLDTPIAIEQWAALSVLQRFALCKLSRPGHENRNFLPALYEFQLKPSPQ